MEVKFKKLHVDAVIPKYAKSGDAGLDLIATSRESYTFGVAYGTGLAVEIPEGYVGLIFPRSSVSNYRYNLANSVGVVDSGYRGEIQLKFRLSGDAAFASSYAVGDKIAQLVIIPYPRIEPTEALDLSKTERGEGGWGSTGK